jgi:hypothetical protein
MATGEDRMSRGGDRPETIDWQAGWPTAWPARSGAEPCPTC